MLTRTDLEGRVARTVERNGRLDIADDNAGIESVGQHIADVGPADFTGASSSIDRSDSAR